MKQKVKVVDMLGQTITEGCKVVYFKSGPYFTPLKAVVKHILINKRTERHSQQQHEPSSYIVTITLDCGVIYNTIRTRSTDRMVVADKLNIKKWLDK